MQVYAHLTDIYLSSGNLLTSVRFSFHSTTDVNDIVPLSITPPGTITALGVNQAIADALVTYLNTTYSLSLVRSNILIIGGATLLSIL